MSVRVFVSYSHRDERYLAKDSLLGFLKGLERTEDVQFWTDQALSAGDLWDETIKSKLRDSDIALVLVSQWFLDSPYCTDTEIRTFLQLCRDRGLAIVPIILSPCEWDRHEWLRSRQCLPRGGKTIEEHYVDPGQQKRLFFDIRQDLRRHIDQARGLSRSPEARSASLATPPAIRTYRREVDRVLRARQGALPPDESRVLSVLARKLEMSGQDVSVVESAARDDYRRLTQEYEQALRSEFRESYALTPPAAERLARLREFLGLSADEAAAVEKRLAEFPKKLARYEKAFEAATRETFPLTERQSAELSRLQQILGLADEDVLPIRARLSSATPGWFFEEILPKTLEIQHELCALIGGRYGVRLTGSQPGEWTLDYTKATVTPTIVDDVELYVEMPSEDFSRLLRGELDVDASFEAGRFKVLGKVELLANLVFVFDAGGQENVTPVFLNDQT